MNRFMTPKTDSKFKHVFALQELANDVSPDSLGTLWDDEDTKAFYKNLPDLMAIIPSILYKDSKGETGTSDANIKKEAESLENGQS